MCFWKVGWLTIIFSVLAICIFLLESCSDVLDEAVCVIFLLMSLGIFVCMYMFCLIPMIVFVPGGEKYEKCERL